MWTWILAGALSAAHAAPASLDVALTDRVTGNVAVCPVAPDAPCAVWLKTRTGLLTLAAAAIPDLATEDGPRPALVLRLDRHKGGAPVTLARSTILLRKDLSGEFETDTFKVEIKPGS
jgi:hypothetical protein